MLDARLRVPAWNVRIGRRSIGSERMNALVIVVVVLLRTGMGTDAAIFLWAVLAGAEFLAECFAGWLWQRYIVDWSERQLRAGIQDITERWGGVT